MPYIFVAMGFSAFWAGVAATIVELAVMIVVSKLMAPSNSQGSQLSNGSTEEYSGTVEPRRIVYGTNLIAGMNAIPPWCSGSKNANLAQVLVLAGHEVASIGDVYLNQELVLSANIGAVTGTSNDGLINTGSFGGHIWLRKHTGSATDTVDYILQAAWPSYWDANHRGLGLAKVFIQYLYDTTVFSAGKPEVRCLVKGKLVYDPRLDTIPGANPTNPSYIAYSSNPALCAVDYILDVSLGIGELPTRIDWPAAVAAANLCDEPVVVPMLISLIPAYNNLSTYNFGDQCQQGGVVYDCVLTTVGHIPPNATYWNPLAAGTGVQKRYTCNTVLDCTALYEDNLKTIAAGFQGAVLYSAGKWVLLPGHWQPSTFAINDDNIAGPIDYQTAVAYASRYNAVRGQFYDPASMYQPMEYPPVRVLADEITDGEGPVWRELQQAGCIDIFEAQRNAIIEQRKSRRKKTWSFPGTYGMYGIRPGDFGTLTMQELSISLQPVRCTGWKLDGKAMTVLLTLEEVNPTDWYDPATVLYQTNSTLLTPAGATFVPDPVGSLSGVGGAGGITFKWTLPSIWHSNLTIDLLEATLDDVTTATAIWSGVNTGVFIQKGDTVTRYYWVRVRNIAGNTTSPNNPSGPTAGLAVASTTITGPPGAAGPPGLPGATGSGGIVGSLTLQAVVLAADNAGHVTSYAGASGLYKCYVGVTDVTDFCSFSLAPNGNPSGLQYFLMGEATIGVVTTGQTEFVDPTGIVSPPPAIGTVTTRQAEAMTGSGSAAAPVAISGTATTRQGSESVAASGSGALVIVVGSASVKYHFGDYMVVSNSGSGTYVDGGTTYNITADLASALNNNVQFAGNNVDVDGIFTSFKWVTLEKNGQGNYLLDGTLANDPIYNSYMAIQAAYRRAGYASQGDVGRFGFMILSAANTGASNSTPAQIATYDFAGTSGVVPSYIRDAPFATYNGNSCGFVDVYNAVSYTPHAAAPTTYTPGGATTRYYFARQMGNSGQCGHGYAGWTGSQFVTIYSTIWEIGTNKCFINLLKALSVYKLPYTDPNTGVVTWYTLNDHPLVEHIWHGDETSPGWQTGTKPISSDNVNYPGGNKLSATGFWASYYDVLAAANAYFPNTTFGVSFNWTIACGLGDDDTASSFGARFAYISAHWKNITFCSPDNYSISFGDGTLTGPNFQASDATQSFIGIANPSPTPQNPSAALSFVGTMGCDAQHQTPDWDRGVLGGNANKNTITNGHNMILVDNGQNNQKGKLTLGAGRRLWWNLMEPTYAQNDWSTVIYPSFHGTFGQVTVPVNTVLPSNLVALIITPAAPWPDAAAGIPYELQLSCNGVAPFTWSLPVKPAWMSIDSVTGIVTGTPAASGAVSVTANVSDSAGSIGVLNV